MQRKYCWITYTASEDGKTATVNWSHATEGQAKCFADTNAINRGGYEGPVPMDMYPIGRTFELETA